MKKQVVTLLMIVLTFATTQTNAQPQWKFHVAFEDATGAKDTIWFIWDTTATFFGLDTTLGEKPVSLNYNLFNVWTHNTANVEYDTLKTIALPYNEDFGHPIEAINFELPITIKWDSAMLHAGWLPPEPVGWVNFARIQNHFFFFYNNMDFDHQFDMTLAHEITAPGPGNTDPWAWEKWVHFPMEIYLVQDPTVSIDHKNDSWLKTLTAFPNPFSGTTQIWYKLKTESNVQLKVYNSTGQLISTINEGTKTTGAHHINFDATGLKNGIYFYTIVINGQTTDTKKMVVK